MDLLDLELDLEVDDSAASTGRATRRSQGASQANVTVTPKPAPKTSKPARRTPKANVAAQKTQKPKPSALPKAAKIKTVSSDELTLMELEGSDTEEPVATLPKAPVKTPVKEAPAEPQEEETIEHSNETSSDSAAVEDRKSRSPSMEKRSRNKTKKRFSPSPVAKKRKSMAAAATPSSSSSASIASKKKVIKVASQEEFTENLREFGDMLRQSSPVDFDIPAEWKSPAPSDTVEQIISQLTGESSNDTKDTPATSAQTSNARNTKKQSSSRRTQASSSSSMPAALSSSEALSTSTEDVNTEERSRSYSRELGVDDEMEEELLVPKKEPVSKKKAVKKEAEPKTPKKRSRKSDTKSEEVVDTVVEEPADEPLEAPEEVPEEAPQAERIARKRNPSKRRSKAEEYPIQDPPSQEPSTSEVPPEPHVTPSKKATKGRSTSRKSEKKVEDVPVEEMPVEIPIEEVAPPKTPAKKPSASLAAAPSRSSGRVSKPNRLYHDVTFNTEILGRTRVSEQNPIKEAQASELIPEVPEVVAAPLSNSIRRKSTAATPKSAPAPKPIPVHNGVQQGYVPSVKVPLESYEEDGVIVNLNEGVTGTMDTLLLKVCKDGVKKHEDIDPKVVRAKYKARVDYAKRVKLQVKKLDIQMNDKQPSTSDDLGKRKRQAPKSIDDIYWVPPLNKTKAKNEAREEREATPVEEQDPGPFPVVSSEKRQQKARESISSLFDAEMDATMKEAKKYSVSFDQFIKPKIVDAQKHADIKLLTRKRQSADPDDFYYHELLVDQVSPSNSNVENQDEEVDVMDVDDDDIIPQDKAIAMRSEAVDFAEQIASIIPRPTHHDGQPLTMDEIREKAMEHLETRRQCLESAIDVVINQFSHESAPFTRDFEAQGCMWHTFTSASAQNLKNIFTISDAFSEDSITWTHQFIVENFPPHLLASYLSMLRFARRLSPSRLTYVIHTTDQIDPEWTQVTALLKQFVQKRVTEPGADIISNTIPYRRMENTVFLLVSPTLTFGEHQRQQRQHGRIFRWLQSIGHADSETLAFTDDVAATTSVAEVVSDMIIEKICQKVRQKTKERPQCSVVLVGYGSTTYLVHRAANLVGGISAIISIGFPVMTPFGRRGHADDEILLTYCPTLFIVGAKGQRFNNSAMKEMRTSMINHSGLVIVGHASDLLLVPAPILLRLGITQTTVYRIILEKILDFLNLETIRTQPLSDLVPVELNNVYDLDSTILKSDKALAGIAFAQVPSASSSAAPSPVGSSGRRATVSGAGGDEVTKKKKELPHTSHSNAPTPSPRNEGEFRAFQSYVTSTVATADDLPRRASLGSSPRVVERGDFRDHRPATAAAAAAPRLPTIKEKPRGPLDPASISLI